MSKKKAPHPRGRHSARKHGKRQAPFPHEHMLMYPVSMQQHNDPDNDGDNDTPGQPDVDAPPAA